MLIRLVLLFCLWAPALYAADNFADRLLEEAAAAYRNSGDDPVDGLLAADRIYYLSHESGKQERLTALLENIYETAQHQELKAEAAYFLTQVYRQMGRLDKVAALVPELGYVPAWKVIGPLEPKGTPDLKKIFKQKEIDGMTRTVTPRVVRAWGADDYFAQGVGHYGYFSGNLAVWPNQLSGALYSTWFYAPTKGRYRLGLGWNNGVKVWVNRKQVFAQQSSWEPHPDQGVVWFEAPKGWHRLSMFIDSAQEDPNLGFFARLTDAEGKALDTNPTHKNNTPGRKVKVVDGETSLAELAKARSTYALATVLLVKDQLRHPEYGNPRDLLATAAEKDSKLSVVEKLLTLTEDVNARLQLLNKHLKVAENNYDRAWTLTALGRIALDQRRYWQARDYADQAKQADPSYWPAQLLSNNIFANLGLFGQSLRNTLELSKAYPDVPWLMMDLNDLYANMDFRDELATSTDAVLAIRANRTKFIERKVDWLTNRGKTNELAEFHKQRRRSAPYSIKVLNEYADFLVTNDRADEAVALVNELLEQLPENPNLLETMGVIKMKAGQPDALPYLEQALALKPQNPILEKTIALSKETSAAFYAPFVVESSEGIEVREVSPVVINVDNTVRKVAPNGQSSLYHQLEWEIITEQGAKELPGYAFSYSPLREKAEVITAEIEREGNVIHLTNFGRRRISDPAYRMYYDLVSYQIAFGQLLPGDVVRVEYRVDDFGGNNIYGDYFGDQQYFANRYPTKVYNYNLILPNSLDVHFHVEKMNPEFNKQAVADNATAYSWSMEAVSPYETEAMMPGLQGYLPYVAVSTFNDWQSMAAWYQDLVDEQVNLDNNTRQIVRDLTEGVTDRREIVKRIHEYVITNTRYVALEFGIHGYKPYEINQVNTRQFGDCKDKAFLIIGMLREAGIPADISIVRTSDKGYVHTFPAMLTYFNHAIAYVPEFDLYLDGTAEFSGLEELPRMDQGALTLLVNAQGEGKLTKIPIYDNTREGHTYKLALDAGGAAEITGAMSYEGAIAPDIRQYLSIDARLDQYVQQLVSDTLPGLDVLEVDRQGRDINEPVTLNFRGRVNRLVQRGDNELRVPLSILHDELTLGYAPNASRQFPIDFGVPRTKSVSLEVAAPEGWVLADLPEALSVADENFAATVTVERQSDTTVTLNYELRFISHRIEPDDYSAFRDMMQAHDRALDQSIRFVNQQ